VDWGEEGGIVIREDGEFKSMSWVLKLFWVMRSNDVKR